jgi:hypothetical protein
MRVIRFVFFGTEIPFATHAPHAIVPSGKTPDVSLGVATPWDQNWEERNMRIRYAADHRQLPYGGARLKQL